MQSVHIFLFLQANQNLPHHLLFISLLGIPTYHHTNISYISSLCKIHSYVQTYLYKATHSHTFNINNKYKKSFCSVVSGKWDYKQKIGIINVFSCILNCCITVGISVYFEIKSDAKVALLNIGIIIGTQKRKKHI